MTTEPLAIEDVQSQFEFIANLPGRCVYVGLEMSGWNINFLEQDVKETMWENVYRRHKVFLVQV